MPLKEYFDNRIESCPFVNSQQGGLFASEQHLNAMMGLTVGALGVNKLTDDIFDAAEHIESISTNNNCLRQYATKIVNTKAYVYYYTLSTYNNQTIEFSFVIELHQDKIKVISPCDKQKVQTFDYHTILSESELESVWNITKNDFQKKYPFYKI